MLLFCIYVNVNVYVVVEGGGGAGGSKTDHCKHKCVSKICHISVVQLFDLP